MAMLRYVTFTLNYYVRVGGGVGLELEGAGAGAEAEQWQCLRVIPFSPSLHPLDTK